MPITRPGARLTITRQPSHDTAQAHAPYGDEFAAPVAAYCDDWLVPLFAPGARQSARPPTSP